MYRSIDPTIYRSIGVRSRRPGMRARAAGVILLVALALTIGAPRLLAWGAAGHHIVARVAWAKMTSEARTQATALLEGGWTRSSPRQRGRTRCDRRGPR